MIDYIKLDISQDLERVMSNESLAFLRRFNEDTGECKGSRSANHLNWFILLRRNKYLTLEGSLHKFFNGGEHNYNDFCYRDMKNTIAEITTQIGFESNTAVLHNIEFGVNIEVPFNVKEFLQNQVINYKGQPKAKNSAIKKTGHMIEFIQTGYLIKFYDKGSQYKLSRNILRFEIRTKRMAFIKSTGIKTLSDLADISKLRKLVPLLLKAFDNILIYDKAVESNLSAEDLTIYLHGINENYWVQLKPKRRLPGVFFQKVKNPDYYTHQKKYYSECDTFIDMLERNNLCETKHILSNLIEQKCNQLIPQADN